MGHSDQISLKHDMDTQFCGFSLDIGHIYPKHLLVSLSTSPLHAAL